MITIRNLFPAVVFTLLAGLPGVGTSGVFLVREVKFIETESDFSEPLWGFHPATALPLLLLLGGVLAAALFATSWWTRRPGLRFEISFWSGLATLGLALRTSCLGLSKWDGEMLAHVEHSEPFWPAPLGIAYLVMVGLLLMLHAVYVGERPPARPRPRLPLIKA